MSLKIKLLLVIFGVLCAFILAEAVFFCSSFWVYHFLENRLIQQSQEYGLKVLCLGDSFTYGIGAGSSQSYPVQLEHILRDHGVDDVVVINGGMPSANSAIVLAKLKSFLEHIDPDIVIIAVGRNDIWNYKQMKQSLNWKVKLKAFFSQSRVYNLLKISQTNFRSLLNKIEPRLSKNQKKDIPDSPNCIEKKILKANELREAHFFKQAIVIYQQVLKKHPKHKVALIEMGRCYKLDNQDDKAIAVLTKALLVDKEDEDVLKELNSIFIEKKSLDQRRDFFCKMTILLPRNKEIKKQLVEANIKLADRYYQQGDRDKAVIYYNKAIYLDAYNTQIYSNLYFNKACELNIPQDDVINDPKARGQFIWEITFNNVAQIADICHEKGIQLVLSGYPEEIYDAVKTVAKDYDVVFVDHRNYFADKRSSEERGKYFTKDGHCTAEGYRIMAETLAAEIMKVIESNPGFLKK